MTEPRTTVAIVGCGYVGLSIALGAARAGLRVLGVETDPIRLKEFQAGRNPVPDVDVPRGELDTLRDDDRLVFDDTITGPAEIHVICVPTPLREGSPDLHYMEEAAEAVSTVLRAGDLVVLESTTYPGTTEELIQPILERGSGMTAGAEFHLAYSPERIDPGNREFGLRNTPKIVGGLTPACTQKAVDFYAKLCDEVVPVSSPRAAEITKLLENTYREVNIALVNEMATVCHDLDIDPWEVIDAAATKPFGFVPFRPGPGVGGHCLLPGERLTVRDDDGVHILAVEALWAREAVKGAHRLGDVEIVEPVGLEIPAADGDQGCWDDVVGLGRRSYAGGAVRIRTHDGRSIAGTEDHRMIVERDGGLHTIPAGRVREGDRLPIWRGHEIWDACLNPRVDLLDHADAVCTGNVGVRLVAGTWKPWKPVIREILGPQRADDVVRSGRLPLDVFFELERRDPLSISREDLVLCTGRGRSARTFPAIVELTLDLTRLVGYYLAEGCVTGSPPRAVFTFDRAETETRDDLRKILDSLGLTYSTWESPVDRATQIKVGNVLFAIFLRDVLGCGANSYDAVIPPRLLATSAAHRRELLTGLLRGDGSVHTSDASRTYEKDGRTYTHRFASAEVSYWTANHHLGRQVEHVLQSLGYVPALQWRKRQEGVNLRIHGGQDLAWLAELFIDKKGDRLRTSLAARKTTQRASRKWHRMGDLHLAEVVGVERFAYRGNVYSLETSPTHTFAASHGIVVHNCIPVDPQYLAWRVRGKMGHQFRLLETASDLNQRMPAFVAQRAAEILNEEGKAVRDASVLILGMAYKGGSGDTRESPAIRVAERLLNRGAKIAYHDPHVPNIELNGDVHDSVELSSGFVSWADLVLILTDHPDLDYDAVLHHASVVYDVRGVTWGLTAPEGAKVYRI